MTAAHNVMYFPKSAGKRMPKQAYEGRFYLQKVQDHHQVMFKVTQYQALPQYLDSESIKDGTDLCLGVAIPDENDPDFSEEALASINPPPLTPALFVSGQEVEGNAAGYPIEVFHEETDHMEENDPAIPYTDNGKMKVKVCHDGDTCSLVYNEKVVFTSKGQSGGLIWVMTGGNTVMMIGHHVGNQDGLNYGVMYTKAIFFDFIFPYIQEQFILYGRSEEGEIKRIEFYKQLEEHDLEMKEREVMRAEKDVKRKNQEHEES